MSKFRKKPIVIEAEQFLLGVEPYPAGIESVWVDQYDDNLVLCAYDEEPSRPGNVAFGMRTREGWYVVRHGDYILTGIEGEKYPCKHSIFKATYEKVEE